MRNPDEILAHYHEAKEDDFLGVIAADLLTRLPFDLAQPFLNPELTVETYQPERWDDDTVIAEMRKYMEFAWEKALGERGISASRSIQHFQSWLWLLGDEYTDLYTFAMKEDNYPQYGKPILFKICERFAFPVPTAEELVGL